MDLVTRQLIPPATKRKELLADIKANVTACNNFTSIRLNNHRLLIDASLDDVRVYLNGRRLDLFYKSDTIQRKFDRQFIRLI
jgi:hypothetical protein